MRVGRSSYALLASQPIPRQTLIMLSSGNRTLWRIASSVFCIAAGYSATAQTHPLQAPPFSASAQLSLHNGVSSYHSGEPIVLDLTFRSNESNCFIVSDTSPSPMDTVELTPVAGAYRWQKGDGPGSDASRWGSMQAGEPSTTSITLNELFRFDEAREYTVSIRTRHLHCGAFASAPASEFVTNSVTFRVEPFSAADERELAESLELGIREAANEQAAEALASKLEYLPGDDATRAKISLTLHPKTFYPFAIDVTKGLWIARNRAMVIGALQSAIDDPSVYIGSELIGKLVRLQRTPLQAGGSGGAVYTTVPPLPDPLFTSYVHELALSLPRRSGAILVDAALTVFEADAHQATRPPEMQTDFEAARELLITHFGEVNEYHVDTLLQGYGQYLADPRILMALQKLIENSTGFLTGNRTVAIKQLQRIAPGGVDRYLVQEACSEHPAMIKEVRDLSVAETLPAVNDCLRARLQNLLSQPAATHMDLRLDRTLEYIARFADDSLVADVLTAYKTRQDGDRRWSQDARGAALCYLMRWDAAAGTPLLLAVLPGGSEADQFIIFGVLAPAMPSNAPLRSLFRQQILAWPADSGPTVYALSQIGTNADLEFLREQLNQFHATHTDHYTPADGKLEIELVTAQIRGRTWDFSGAQGKHISQSECRTTECRKAFGTSD